jgi:hypothetical protein
VLPTPLNHTIFIVITVAVLIVPIVLARASKEGARP